MSRTTWISGALVASAAAGPIVVGMLALLAIMTSRMEPFWSTLGFLVFALVFAFPFGFILSLIPNVAGTALLVWFGKRHGAARHWLVWTVSGFVLGFLISAVWSADTGIGNVALGVVGLLCAVICHQGTDWPD